MSLIAKIRLGYVIGKDGIGALPTGIAILDNPISYFLRSEAREFFNMPEHDEHREFKPCYCDKCEPKPQWMNKPDKP